MRRKPPSRSTFDLRCPKVRRSLVIVAPPLYAHTEFCRYFQRFPRVNGIMATALYAKGKPAVRARFRSGALRRGRMR